MNEKERINLYERHTLVAERYRASFIGRFKSVCRDMLSQLLMFSQTGNESNIEQFLHILNFDFNKVWIDFIKHEGFLQ